MKLALCLLLSLLPVAGFARPDPAANPPATPPRATGSFFALSVPDLEASTRWYRDTLGLEVKLRPEKSGPAAVAILEGGGLIVELIQHDEARPLAEAAPTVKGEIFTHGVFKAGVMVDDYAATIARLRERGAEFAFGPFPAGAGQKANAIVRDNAGNLVQFIDGGRPAAADGSPEAIVQAQLDAYNRRDLEGFLAFYSDDAVLKNHPDEVTQVGKEQMRARYTQRFANPAVHAQILKRMVMGRFVVDEERITAPPSKEVIEAVAIYEVRDGKIVSVSFLKP